VIVWVGAFYIVWEWFAKKFHKPLVTDLSHMFPWCIFVYGYVAWLFVHFLMAARRG
jgi:hypothetical protein